MTTASTPVPMKSRRSKGLKGRLRVPGDKSISHRALIFGLLTVGETSIQGLLEGADVLATGGGLPQARCRRDAHRRQGLEGTRRRRRRPAFARVLRSTSAMPAPGSRLMMGVVAGHGVTATFDGDASLRKRPMMRVLTPLLQMGAEIASSAEGGRLPLRLARRRRPRADHLRDAGRHRRRSSPPCCWRASMRRD